MNKEIELLYKTIEAKDKIINEQALEITKLKKYKDRIEEQPLFVKKNGKWYASDEIATWLDEQIKITPIETKVEIIEDTIQKLDIDKYTGVEDLVDKINELIDEVNKLKVNK